jgi:hypothetical protein
VRSQTSFSASISGITPSRGSAIFARKNNRECSAAKSLAYTGTPPEQEKGGVPGILTGGWGGRGLQ